jgi:hypothetical protein
MSESKPTEDYQSSLTEKQKELLDDAPLKVVTVLIEYCNNHGQMPFFNLKKTDKLTGETSFEEFRGVSAVNAMDYLRYLIRNGYKGLADAG